MDPEFALLILESELLGDVRIAPEQFAYFSEAVAAAAAVPEGYSGLAWQGGAKLLKEALSRGHDPTHFFSTFGWDALATGIRAGLENNQVLSALSYASLSFLPPAESSSVFDHPQISRAVRTGLGKMPHPFIKPAELNAADEAVQAQFGELLKRLSSFGADNELLLQWSASALRVLLTQSHLYQTAAISLLETLCLEGRIAAAYYAFRAMAEQHDDLWDHPVALRVLQSLIDQYWQDSEVGEEVLAQLCVDDDVVRRLDQRFDLLVLIGVLAINRVQCRAHDRRTETTAWRLVNEVFGTSALVASALSDYLTDGSLPPVPVCKIDQIEDLEREFRQAVALVEKDLGPRKYKTLAMRIYQSNIQEVFSPILDRIRSGHCSSELVKQIREIDPEELVTGSEWLDTTPHRIGTKVLRKMTSDNRRTLETLESAAHKGIELDRAKAEFNSQPTDEFEFFQEFEMIVRELGTAAQWALKTLLPDFWTRFQEGLSVAIKEMEARHHAAREY